MKNINKQKILKKNMKFYAIDHPQTEEILAYKNRCDDFKKEFF